MKKVFSVVCIVALLCTMLPAGAAFAANEGISKYYLPEINLGSPLESARLQNAIVDEYNGTQYMYTSSDGSGAATLNVINLDTMEVVDTKKLPGAGKIWRHAKDSKGRIYAVGSPKLYRYDPETREVTDLGRYSETDGNSFTLCVDEKDNVYVGTYPNAKIIKLDPTTDTFEDFGNIVEGGQYVRTIAYHNGYLYCGTYGTPPGKMVRVNASNPSDKKVFEMPDFSDYNPSEIGFVYESSVAGDYILYYVQTPKGYMMYVFDTVNAKWVNMGDDISFKGLYTTEVLDGKVYFSQRYGDWKAFDTTTTQIIDLGWKLETSLALWGGGWIEVKNDPDFPGKTYATLDLTTTDSALMLINFETKKTKRIDGLALKGGYQNLLLMEKMPDGTLYVPGSSNTLCHWFNPETGKSVQFPAGQIEGSVSYNGKLYLGAYTHARILEYDPSQPPSDNNVNPKQIAAVTDQDRPFAMTAGDGKVYGGTIAKYGTLRGAIFIYDVETGEYYEELDVVKNHSVMGLAYKDGYLYGSTTVHGGLGVEASEKEKEAKIFVYDVKNRKKIKEFVPDIPGLNNPRPTYIGDLEFGPDGKLWGATGVTLFSIDPVTEKVSDVLNFGDAAYGTEGHTWKPKYIEFDDDGNLYVALNGLKVVNTKTMEYKKLTGYKAYSYAIGADGNMYLAVGTDIRVIPILDQKPTFEYLAYAQGYYSDKLVLKVDNPLASVDGKPSYIDPANNEVAPIVEDGRTLVPVRFIAESLGAEVAWDDATQTATLKKDTTSVSITIGQNKMTVNGREVALDVPAQLKNERTLLPLRAVSDALGKQVLWGGDESGLIVIADEEQKLSEEQILALNLYHKYYLKTSVVDETVMEQGKKDYQQLLAKTGGKRIEIPNQSFEKTEGDGIPANFTRITGENYDPESMVSVSSFIALDGENALHLQDNSGEMGAGYQSELVEIDPSKQYKLIVPLYVASGRTCMEVYTYNAEGKQLYRYANNYTPSVLGVWSFPEIEIGMKGNPKYISVRIHNSALWQGDAYYDNLTLIELD